MATVASLALGWRGDLVTAVESSGYTVDVVVRFNSAELVRRDFGPPVLDRAALRAMLSLPAGITVPCTDIPTQDLLALELAESPVVELAGAGVRRLYEPACDIVGILATDRPLRRAVDAVGMFSPFAERSVFGTARQCRTQLAYASRFGIGVAAVEEPGATVLLRPQRRSVRPSSARWRFCEQIYEKWLRDLSAARHAFRYGGSLKGADVRSMKS